MIFHPRFKASSSISSVVLSGASKMTASLAVSSAMRKLFVCAMPPLLARICMGFHSLKLQTNLPPHFVQHPHISDRFLAADSRWFAVECRGGEIIRFDAI